MQDDSQLEHSANSILCIQHCHALTFVPPCMLYYVASLAIILLCWYIHGTKVGNA